MKSGHRTKSFRLWRAGHAALKLAQANVDKMLGVIDPTDVVTYGAIVDLKIRVNREVRDDLRLECFMRREQIALDDLELAQKTDEDLLLRLRDRIDAQIKGLQSDEDKPNDGQDEPPDEDGVTSEAPEPPAMEPPGQEAKITPASSDACGDGTGIDGIDLGPENDG